MWPRAQKPPDLNPGAGGKAPCRYNNRWQGVVQWSDYSKGPPAHSGECDHCGTPIHSLEEGMRAKNIFFFFFKEKTVDVFSALECSGYTTMQKTTPQNIDI